MITWSQHPAQQACTGRFAMMMTHVAYVDPATREQRSLLCRVLDGRGLEEVCPLDSATLTLDERAHYHSALKHPRALALAVRTRAELRRMLSREVGLPPYRVPLQPDAHGKPRCPHPAAEGLAFSVSHTEDCALIGIGDAVGIGVDLEPLLTEEPSDENLEILFDEDEFRAWARLAPLQRRAGFTQAWTIKEAALKALGTGLDGSPHEIPVQFDSQGNATPLLPGSRWLFERLDFSPYYAASFIAILGE